MKRKLRNQMRRHVLDVAEQHGVTVTWTLKGWRHGTAFVDVDQEGGGLVVLPRILTAGDYLICLHELGHVIDENALRYYNSVAPYDVALCESAAWAWAAENVAEEIRPHLRLKDWRRAGEAWITYLTYWGPDEEWERYLEDVDQAV